jgi:hypothetical protein
MTAEASAAEAPPMKRIAEIPSPAMSLRIWSPFVGFPVTLLAGV